MRHCQTGDWKAGERALFRLWVGDTPTDETLEMFPATQNQINRDLRDEFTEAIRGENAEIGESSVELVAWKLADVDRDD